MELQEFFKRLQFVEETPDVDENEVQDLQSSEQMEIEDSAEQVGAPEDTPRLTPDVLDAIVNGFEERDNATSARIEKLERTLTQLLNKTSSPVATSPQEPNNDTPEEYTPLLDLDYATPAPKL